MWAGRLVPLLAALVLSFYIDWATAVRGVENGLEVLAAADLLELNATRDDVYGCCCTTAKDCSVKVVDLTFKCPSGFSDFTQFRADKPKACKEGTLATAAARQVGTPVTIRAYWMRHGWSCANALQDQKEHPFDSTWTSGQALAASLKFKWYGDPSLTDVGAYRASALGKHVRKKILEQTSNKVPLVFSSNMVRAMETALFNFPEWNLRPIPYIAEVDHGPDMPDNTPSGWDKQTEKLAREPMTPELVRKILYDENRVDHPDRIKRKSNYEAFLAYFPAVLQNLIQAGKGGATTVTNNAVIPVVIVGHSGYMKDHLRCGKTEGRKPNNNEVWVQDFTVNLGAWDARLVASTCAKLFDDASFFPKRPTMLCDIDVIRCGQTTASFKPAYWLDDDRSKCLAAHVTTNIVERDLASNVPYATPPS